MILLVTVAGFAQTVEIDPNGYVMYCPCMGKNYKL